MFACVKSDQCALNNVLTGSGVLLVLLMKYIYVILRDFVIVVRSVIKQKEVS